jgi:prepilin-type processing-associated H-X9-DG protein
MLRIAPFIEAEAIGRKWNWSVGISDPSNLILASLDIKGFYCPTRRGNVRVGTDIVGPDVTRATSWIGGGNDYGGCAGRHKAFVSATGSPLYLDSSIGTGTAFSAGNAATLAGIFGQANASTTFGGIRDGLSNTIMAGEVQRLPTGTASGPSWDGWAIGGAPTLFTTGDMWIAGGASPVATGGLLMNNGFFGSPGSEHSSGANFCLADGSVAYLGSSMNPLTFALMGSMADGEPLQP